MAVGNLYYYFKDKEELLAFVQEDALAGLLALAARVRATGAAGGRPALPADRGARRPAERGDPRLARPPGGRGARRALAAGGPGAARRVRARLPRPPRGRDRGRRLPAGRSQGERARHPRGRELDREVVPAGRRQDRPRDRPRVRGVAGAWRREGGAKAAQLKINAVEMVRGIREAHYEKIKDLSTKDKIEFFREKARALHAELGVLSSERDHRTVDP